ncbi:MAG: glycoside hydrolase family 15 protein [Bdellovibrionales bacterium]
MFSVILFLLGLNVSAETFETSPVPSVMTRDVPAMIQLQKPRALSYLLQNISPADTALGVVVASPSKSEPDYYYHWVRDAALVMASVQDRLEKTSESRERQFYEKKLFDFAAFSRRNQLARTLSGFGEPKFFVDGRGFDGPWGRPQNDGPALRALTLIRFAKHLLKDPLNRKYVVEHLYDSKLPTQSAIKADLEYVSHHWRAPSFDLWEEVFGEHFYTHMVQRASLVEGAKLAEMLKDPEAARFYRTEAIKLEAKLKSYWNGRYIGATRTPSENKPSNLDLAVVLGVLHGDTQDGFYSVNSPQVRASVQHLEEAFYNLYRVNRNGQIGIAIGRYPEDTYDGVQTNSLGNPWFLGNHALAEYYYKLAKDSSKKISPLQRAEWMQKGDEFLARSFSHMNQSNGSFSEQFHRTSGYMQGARDLTWSYASFLTATEARQF